MTELMIPMEVVQQPAVLLASGPGPAPTAEDRIPPFYAMLSQLDRETGLRGWMLQVQDGPVRTWPKRHFSRATAGRPPMIEAREEALAALGYEVADPGARWRWHESVTLDAKHVQMYAVIFVQPLAAPAGEAAAL